MYPVPCLAPPIFGQKWVVWAFCFSACNAVWCENSVVIFFFFFPLYCSRRFQSSSLTLSVIGFPIVWKLLHDSLCRWGHCPLIPCLSFHLLSFVLPSFEKITLRFWYLVFPTSIEKLVCGSCSTFIWSFDGSLGEKVVSLSYSSTIMGPPSLFCVFLSYILILLCC